MKQDQQVKISHYSDLLCIWAYISQIRMDELEAEFDRQVAIDYRLFPVFGDVATKIETNWSNKGGLKAYNRHVLDVATRFDHLEVSDAVWLDNTPQSSLPCHLYLAAIRTAQALDLLPAGSFTCYKKILRQAFFVELQDISQSQVLDQLLERCDIAVTPIVELLKTGRAYAALAQDMQQAKDLAVRSSPTLIFNEDRQRLAGNVGYKIIQANIRELLDSPQDKQTWC